MLEAAALIESDALARKLHPNQPPLNACAPATAESAEAANHSLMSLVHECWVTVVSPEEAIARVMARNSLPRDEAEQRVRAQISNAERLANADVVLSTVFAPEFTVRETASAASLMVVSQLDMVKKAWGLLQQRLAIKRISLCGTR